MRVITAVLCSLFFFALTAVDALALSHETVFNGATTGVSGVVDVIVGNQDINVPRIWFHSNQSVSQSVTVYYRSGTGNGTVTSTAGWTTIYSGPVVPLGPGNRTEVDITDVSLDANQRYSFYVYTGTSGTRYTSRSSGVWSQGFPGADMNIVALFGRNNNLGPTGTLYERTFNIQIEYSLVPS